MSVLRSLIAGLMVVSAFIKIVQAASGAVPGGQAFFAAVAAFYAILWAIG